MPTAPDYVGIAVAAIEEELDDDEVPPSPLAIATCRRLVASMEREFRGVPAALPRISSLGSGDLLCMWRRGDADLWLLVSPDGALRLAKVPPDATIGAGDVLNPSAKQLAAAVGAMLGG